MEINTWVLTRKACQSWDEQTIKRGLPSKTLMAMAAQSAFDIICQEEWFSPNLRFHILVGGGNNGGDGYVLAWLLAGVMENPVKVYVYQKPYRDDAIFYHNLCRLHERIEIVDFAEFAIKDLSAQDVVVDAIFGTGFNKELPSELSHFFAELNQKQVRRIAMDLPSGVFADGDFFEHVPFSANLTITMGAMKPGLLLPPGIYYSGKVVRAVTAFVPIPKSKGRMARKQAIPPLRRVDGHKYSSGVLHLWGGSAGMEGAAVLAGSAFLASGGGLVRWFSSSEHAFKYLQSSPELMVRFYDKQDELEVELLSSLKRAKKALLAMGMGLREKPSPEFVQELLAMEDLIWLMDASFLHYLSSYEQFFQLKQRKSVFVMTPHQGEAEALLGKKIHNYRETALELAQRYQAFVYLKGPGGILVSPEGEEIYFHSRAYNLATGGTGDILSGLICSFLLRPLAPLEAIEQAILFYLDAALEFQDRADFFAASCLVEVFRRKNEVLQ
ncbi:MAG: NAD(P)H-hydrate epimerase [Leptospiraceae bacterium]|nr:NAD(P)H-hydrate epimerase [Leptospiraceae bacterium]MDW8305917.1 NAD(P)H-hydrate epimerase [Leptospiraceae bacterium]